MNTLRMFLLSASLSLAASGSAQNSKTLSSPIYVDLETGDTIEIWYDAEHLLTRNKMTSVPVTFYINRTTGDTVYGKGRFVVNNMLVRNADGSWGLDHSKVKVDGDELKIKDGNRKLKIDGDELKIKDNGRKTKVENGEVEVKKKGEGG